LKSRIVVSGAVLAALALTPVAATQADSPKPVKKTVRIGDNFFAPDSLRVPRNSVITWKWPSTPGDVHDVALRSRPKGVKKFHSELSASDYRFRRKLVKPGKYSFVCTIHAEMQMTIRVRR
jgi:plastocyanin